MTPVSPAGRVRSSADARPSLQDTDPRIRILIIADDLTGADDTAVPFAELGATTRVAWIDPASLNAQTDALSAGDMISASSTVLAISTESRHCTEDEAVRRVCEALARLPISGGQEPAWIYKKIDSTLRGHPGAELAAVMEAVGASRALVAPAFPAQGRVTRGGRHYVHGVPLMRTAFARELSSDDTIGSSEIAALLARFFPPEVLRSLPLARVREGAAAVASLMTEESGVWIADAETDADLRYLADAAVQSGIRLLCGSAGLAQALVTTLAEEEPSSAKARPSPAHPSGRGVLVVATSRHPITLRQIQALESARVPVIRPSPSWFRDGDTGPVVASIIGALVPGAAARADLTACLDAAVLTTAGLPEMPGQGELLTARLAEATAALLAQHRLAGLVLTGGDAAIAVCRALKADALHLQGAVAPGIPWGCLVGGPAPGLPVVTKAGGFGEDDALLTILRFLRGTTAHGSSVARSTL